MLWRSLIGLWLGWLFNTASVFRKTSEVPLSSLFFLIFFFSIFLWFSVSLEAIHCDDIDLCSYCMVDIITQLYFWCNISFVNTLVFSDLHQPSCLSHFIQPFVLLHFSWEKVALSEGKLISQNSNIWGKNCRWVYLYPFLKILVVAYAALC